jgi:serine/threonine-protein kinase
MNQPHGTIGPEDYQQVREVFEAALHYPAADRVGFVERACGGDARLLGEVQRMLAADAETHPLSDARPLSGQVLRDGDRFASHFEIGGTLGRGGMGEVYLGRDTKLNREVAIKVRWLGSSDARTVFDNRIAWRRPTRGGARVALERARP